MFWRPTPPTQAQKGGDGKGTEEKLSIFDLHSILRALCMDKIMVRVYTRFEKSNAK